MAGRRRVITVEAITIISHHLSSRRMEEATNSRRSNLAEGVMIKVQGMAAHHLITEVHRLITAAMAGLLHQGPADQAGMEDTVVRHHLVGLEDMADRLRRIMVVGIRRSREGMEGVMVVVIRGLERKSCINHDRYGRLGNE
jgi:hypothetical protein